MFTKDNLQVDDNKLLGYALDQNHPCGRDKAIAFEKALGYNKSNYKILKEQIIENVDEYIPIERRANEYGRVFSIVISITGVNSKQAAVQTGWLLEKGQTKLRLTSAYVTNKKINYKKEASEYVNKNV
ncbi:MAG: DUF6883 domain-containing protein [Bacillota bacterium]